MISLSLCIFLLPLCGFAFLALFHQRLVRHGDWLATGIMGAAVIGALYLFFNVWGSAAVYVAGGEWLPLDGREALRAGVLIDSLTAVMMLVVTAVSFLVHVFSLGYMHGDVRYGRYFCSLQLFSASMLGLVLADNLLFLFIFWELVGLSSYLLIGHWFEKRSASDAAIKAFITTRIGDVGMFLALLICYTQVGSLHYADIFAAVESGGLAGEWRTLAGLGLFLGAMGKSAQFPLHVWLPDAMEGPTPVSALIHAATMVAAGVYLVGRAFPIFDPLTLLCIAYIGGFTALFAATIALVQDDIKRVLAYSTLSQLGYMMLALGVGGYVSGLFHLVTHAFFKAGLFLGSGAVIFAMHHEQSMSRYGGLARRMPVTAWCYLLCTLALIGFPGFSGFWSKDAILADVLSFTMGHGHWFLAVAGFGTVALTALYMLRQYFLTFLGSPRGGEAYSHAHEVGWHMKSPLIVLAILAIGAGGFGNWFAQGNPLRTGSEQVAAVAKAGYHVSPADEVSQLQGASAALQGSHAAHHTAQHEIAGHGQVSHDVHATAMMLSIGLAVCGMLLAGFFYYERPRKRKALFAPKRVAARISFVYRLLWNKYFIDELYRATVIRWCRLVSTVSAWFDRWVVDAMVDTVGLAGRMLGRISGLADRRVLDGSIVEGTAAAAQGAGQALSRVQTGYLRHYLLMAMGAIAGAGVTAIALWVFLYRGL